MSLADLESNGAEPSNTKTTTVNLSFVMRVAKAGNGDLGYQFSLATVDLGPSLATAPNAPALAAELAQSIEALPLMSFQSIGQFVAQGGGVSNSPLEIGMNCHTGIDAAASRVSLRAELGEADKGSLAQWTPWLQGNLPDHLGNSLDWAVFIHEIQLRAGFKSSMSKWVAAATQDPDITAAPVPEPSWTESPPRVQMSVSATAVDACPTPVLWDWHDVDFTVESKLDYNRPAIDKLELQSRISWSASEADKFFCALNMAAFGPFLAPFITNFAATADPGKDLSAGDYYLANFAGPIAYFAGTYASISRGLNARLSFVPAGFQEVESSDSDREYIRTFDVDLTLAEFQLPDTPSIVQMRATFASLNGTSDGLVLGGPLQNTSLVPKSAKLDVGSFDQEWHWSWKNVCSAHRRIATRKHIVLHNKSIKKLGELHQPLQMLGLEVLDDEQNQYKPYVKVVIGGDHGALSVEIPHADLKPEFLADPYPLRVLLRTTGGSRILDLGTVTTLDSTQHAVLQAGVKALILAKCKPFIHVLWGRLFNPQWMIDPPPYDQHAERLWAFALENAPQDMGVVVTDQSGEPLAGGRPAADGRMTVYVLTSQEADASPVVGFTSRLFGEQPVGPSPPIGTDAGALELARSSPRARPALEGSAMNSGARLSVRQAQLVAVSTFVSPAPIRRVAAFGSSGRFALLTNVGAIVVSLEDRMRPRALRMIRGSFRGVGTAFDGIVLWGEQGAAVVRDDEERRLLEQPVRDVVSHGRALYVLTDGELLTFSSDLSSCSATPAADFDALERIREQVNLARGEELFELNVAGDDREVQTVGDASSRHGGRIEGAQSVRYAQSEPWLQRAVKSGDVFCRQVAGRLLRFYVMAASHEMDRSELESAMRGG